MIVGEAPGADEARLGIPFVGTSGALLREVMHAVGLNLSNTYLTNAVKHRPPGNRNPSEEESLACVENFLVKEIELLKPKLILCTGRISASAMLRLAGLAVPNSSLRGLKFRYNGTPVLVTWHPAYICRQPEKKPELISDLKLALYVATTGTVPKPIPVHEPQEEAFFGEANVIYDPIPPNGMAI